jgi:hypothetical protein
MIKIYSELDLERFNAWGGAQNTLETIIDNKLVNAVESLLCECYPDGMSDSELNDLLWFESDWIFESIGFSDDDDDDDD